jgi:hypothetical protein
VLLTALAVLVVSPGCKPRPPTTTFRQASDAALETMEKLFFDPIGEWNMCVPTLCEIPYTDFDWGADSSTDALYMRWTFVHDPAIPPMMTALNTNGLTYGTCTADLCPSWSDVPMWDTIAAVHMYQVLGDPKILARAKLAFTYVDTATEFKLGACPTVDYQAARGGTNNLKTLESDSNYIKAALLLHEQDPNGGYLAKAVAQYANVRPLFLDPDVPLYTVWLIDDGTTCPQIPHRFYASVNGNMIWAGVTLAAATGQSSYMDDAVATAQAFAQKMNDNAGIYADLQSDDDVEQPLIEGMYLLATQGKQAFARDWLLTNARALTNARLPSGAYGRFFDGPAPPADVTEWQSNGGLALAFVAGELDPTGIASDGADPWAGAISVADDFTALPTSIQFTGKAIAVYGTLGEDCCTVGHARVFIDGAETFDQRGVWQNEVNNLQSVPDSILFAWRWPTSGKHTIEFQPGLMNPKEGGPFLHVQRYEYVP